jgi:hypothetical protein
MSCLWIILGVIVLVAIAMILRHAKFSTLATDRAGENFDSFRASFASDVPDDVVRAVYVVVQQLAPVRDFPVRADDGISDLYGTVDEDLDDAVMEALAACGRQLPPKEEMPQPVRIDTVRDLVQFVAACPMSECTSS